MRWAWIFGLGIQKTGNTSVKAALKRLGFYCRQGHGRARTGGFEYLFQGDPAMIEVGSRSIDAWIDSPVFFYEWLPDISPNAVYIHNIRETRPWLGSMARQFYEYYFLAGPRRRRLATSYYHKLFGKPWPTPSEAAESKHRIDAAIARWLADRRRLTIDVARESDWHLKLSRLLDCEWPGGPAPHENVTDYQPVDPAILTGTPLKAWAPILSMVA